MRKCLLLPVLSFLVLTVRSQSITRYKDTKGNRFDQQQIDSMIQAKNTKLKDLGMTAQIEILDQSRSGDTLLLNYRLNVTNAGVDANDLKKEKYLHQPLPAFSYQTITGKKIDSKELQGKPVVINLWFTTCKPCIAEMPQLNRIKQKYSSSDIVFLSMTYETKNSVLSFLKSRQFDFVIIAGAEEYCATFTDNYPVTIFVDRQGIIQAVQNGKPFKFDDVLKTHLSEDDPSGFEEELAKIK